MSTETSKQGRKIASFISNTKVYFKIICWIVVELCYNYQFHRSDSSVLDHHHCEKIFHKYSFHQKISNKVYYWLIVKRPFVLMFFTIFPYYYESTGNKLCLLSFDWMNSFEKFFHSDDDLRLKNHSCENGSYNTILQEVDYFLLHFHFSIFWTYLGGPIN